MQSAKWGSGRSSYWPPPVKPVLRLGQQAGRRKKREAPPQWPAGAFSFPSPFFLISAPPARRRRFGGGHFSTGRPVHCYEVSKRAPPLGLMEFCYGLALVNSFLLILAEQKRPKMASRINRIPLGRSPYFGALSCLQKIETRPIYLGL